MTTYYMHYPDNGHSLRRIAMLWRLYLPGFKPGFIICAAAPLVLILISATIAHLTGEPSGWASWIIGMLTILSPIMLSRRDYRHVSAQLPVTATEKLVFLLLTFWVAVPLLITLSSWAGEWICTLLYGKQTVDLITFEKSKVMPVISYFGDNFSVVSFITTVILRLSIITIVLYYMVVSKKNRVLSAFVSLFVTAIAAGLLLAIMGGVVGFIVGYTGVAQELSEEAIQEMLARNMIKIFIAAWGMIALAGIIYLVKLYKKLRNHGF